MDRLWAPWRMQYISGDDKKEEGSSERAGTGCIFCDKPLESRDRENLIVERGPTCFVILNAFPYNNGHLMVVPYRHLDHPRLLSPEEQAELMATATRMTGSLSELSRPDGYNIGMNVGSAAGAGIASHLHLHVVPRWNGDTNFMPVLADTKVMPQTLSQVWERLAAQLSAESVEINEGQG
ncbi:MAG: HIT domain-containing protein [Cytophagales bacterium]|nr:HIT domain-containing protein [Armatimonadota bacterium]